MDERRHTIVVDLGFGDAGKGSLVDYLTSRHHTRYAADRPSLVVRFNGGAQAGHRVVAPDGRQHVFASFGSGFFNGAETHLSRFALIDPLAIFAEAEDLKRQSVGEPLRSLSVDRRALLVTPFHAAANRAREAARGTARHGSCGMGIGETVAYALAHGDLAPRVADLQDRPTLTRKLWTLHDTYLDLVPPTERPPIDLLLEVYRAFANWVRIVDEHWLEVQLARRRVVFEGAQGALLDAAVGFHPYTTWSNTTFANAETLLTEAGQPRQATRLGVLRAYGTRHGPGPFPAEDAALTAALPDPANGNGGPQGAFRVGHLDLVLARYAVEAVGPLDGLALTNLDRLTPAVQAVTAYGFPAIPATQNGLISAHSVLRDDLVEPQPARPVERLTVPADRAAQAALTLRLATARPELVPLTDPVAQLTAATGVPVLIASHGPAAKHKQHLDTPNWLGQAVVADPRHLGAPAPSPTIMRAIAGG